MTLFKYIYWAVILSVSLWLLWLDWTGRNSSLGTWVLLIGNVFVASLLYYLILQAIKVVRGSSRELELQEEENADNLLEMLNEGKAAEEFTTLNIHKPKPDDSA